MVSIPKRVSEALKLLFGFLPSLSVPVSIPKRVSEALKPRIDGILSMFRRRFQSLKGFQRL